MTSGAPDDGEAALLSLAPEYRPEFHAGYLDLLKGALANPLHRNIALAGPYGTGKSSILQKLTAELKKDDGPDPVTVTLASLGGEPVGSPGETNPSAVTTTNLIQKEIVKQLLYQVPSRSAPRSQFHRSAAPGRWDGAWFSVAVGLAAAVLAIAARPVLSITHKPVWYLLIAFLAVAVGVGALVFLFRRLTHGRFTIQQVSAGPAGLTLSPQSTSYFDEYLDEIVYFFSISKRRLVIFEDLDRFNDRYIFETLRSLNTLLNEAADLQDTSPVQFVYAMRDSIFDDRTPKSSSAPSGDAEAEVELSARTKFFDVIVPVVPFITHENARDLLVDLFKEGTGVSSSVVDILGRHLADMRLIRNLHNKFHVARDRLIRGERHVPGLTEDQLLALLAYKAIYPADYEAIRHAKSRLDDLYEAGRTMVEEEDAELAKRQSELTNESASRAHAEERADTLGGRLEAIFSGFYASGLRQGTRNVASSDFRTVSFWRDLCAGSPLAYTSYDRAVTIDSQRASAMLGTKVDLEQWDDTGQAQTEAELLRVASAQKKIRHADWLEMLSYRSPVGGRTNAFHAKVKALGSPLTHDLIFFGLLTEYFALNVSLYYGNLTSPRALNFIQRNVDRGHADMLYNLEPADVEAILANRPSAINDVSMYNVSILEHLAPPDGPVSPKARMIAKSVAKLGTEEMAFLDTCVLHLRSPGWLIQSLAGTWPGVFEYVVGAPKSGTDRRGQLFDAALRGASADVTYKVSAEVQNFVTVNLRSLVCLYDRRPALTPGLTTSFLQSLGVAFEDVTGMNQVSLDAVADTDSYAFTRTNLVELVEEHNLPLDRLKRARPEVFARALVELASYLDLIAGTGTPSIERPADFVATLLAVYEAQPDLLGKVLDRAARDLQVVDIAEMPNEAMPTIAGHGRMALTVANLDAYITKHRVDAQLARALGELHELSQDAEDNANQRVALALVNGVQHLPSAAQRVELAASIASNHFDPAEVTPESGPLAALLLDHGLVTDDAETFTSELMVDGPTCAEAFARSQKYSASVEPSSFTTDFIGDVLRHPGVPATTKTRLIADPGFFSGAPAHALSSVLDVATSLKIQLGEQQILALVDPGIPDTPRIIRALAASALDSAALIRVLRQLGGAWADVSGPGKTQPELPDDPATHDVLDRLPHVTGSRPSKRNGYIRALRKHH
jgi:hypothetical protein